MDLFTIENNSDPTINQADYWHITQRNNFAASSIVTRLGEVDMNKIPAMRPKPTVSQQLLQIAATSSMQPNLHNSHNKQIVIYLLLGIYYDLDKHLDHVVIEN